MELLSVAQACVRADSKDHQQTGGRQQAPWLRRVRHSGLLRSISGLCVTDAGLRIESLGAVACVGRQCRPASGAQACRFDGLEPSRVGSPCPSARWRRVKKCALRGKGSRVGGPEAKSQYKECARRHVASGRTRCRGVRQMAEAKNRARACGCKSNECCEDEVQRRIALNIPASLQRTAGALRQETWSGQGGALTGLVRYRGQV
jgi:hypothetical protein